MEGEKEEEEGEEWEVKEHGKEEKHRNRKRRNIPGSSSKPRKARRGLRCGTIPLAFSKAMASGHSACADLSFAQRPLFNRRTAVPANQSPVPFPR